MQDPGAPNIIGAGPGIERDRGEEKDPAQRAQEAICAEAEEEDHGSGPGRCGRTGRRGAGPSEQQVLPKPLVEEQLLELLPQQLVFVVEQPLVELQLVLLVEIVLLQLVVQQQVLFVLQLLLELVVLEQQFVVELLVEFQLVVQQQLLLLEFLLEQQLLVRELGVLDLVGPVLEQQFLLVELLRKLRLLGFVGVFGFVVEQQLFLFQLQQFALVGLLVPVERFVVVVGMRKLILRNFQSPGDLVMLTAALRDLHACYPRQFRTDVRTSCPQLWENNPHLTALDEKDPEVKVLNCDYPLVHQSNEAPYHFIHGFIDFLNRKLDLAIRPTRFKGDLHISALEKSWFSQVREIVGEDLPFWIVVSGGKFDFTAKWWDPRRTQEVVDHFRGKILFVQVGEDGHHHPPLRNVIDLRGKTDLRQLVRLVYHSQGVLTAVNALMHLAAAVEVKGGKPQNRPCVVVAGGREPSQWEAYPHHQYIHMNGALMCCDNGGCWKSRAVPLGDGDKADRPENLCVDVVGTLPRCLDLITAADVIRRIDLYFQGGAVRPLSDRERGLAEAALRPVEAVGT